TLDCFPRSSVGHCTRESPTAGETTRGWSQSSGKPWDSGNRLCRSHMTQPILTLDVTLRERELQFGLTIERRAGTPEGPFTYKKSPFDQAEAEPLAQSLYNDLASGVRKSSETDMAQRHKRIVKNGQQLFGLIFPDRL